VITNRNIKYFNLAKNMSELSDFDKHHIGCVVVYKYHILSVGFNTNKTHPIQMEYNKFRQFNNPNNVHHKLHAEIMTLCKIKDLDIDWNKVEMYVYRQNYQGDKALSAPCRACREFLKDVGVKNLYYTGNDSYCYEKIG